MAIAPTVTANKGPEFLKDGIRYVRVPRRSATWRWIHWIDAASILVLIVTGLFIANPFFVANIRYLMGWDIAIHLYAAMVLDVSIIVIAYLYLFSRDERGIDQLVPTRENLIRLKEAFLNVILLNRRKRFDSSQPDPLNALWYVVLHVLVVLQLLTGLQLYVSALSNSSVGAWWPDLCHFMTDWTVPWLGSLVAVRMFHYAVMWFVLAWIVLHIYYEWWRTVMWNEGDITIMFGGYKYVAVPVEEPGSSARLGRLEWDVPPTDARPTGNQAGDAT
jgi:Ni/Fe-hydrogenase 1 B-type cytochrome subunit